MALWSDWKKLVEEASKMAYADEYQDFDEILDVMEYADPAEDDALYKAIEAAHNLDNAALAAEIEKLNNMMEAVKEAVKNAIQPNQDVTNKLLVNPTFNMLDGDTEKPQYGWTGWGNTTNGMPTTGGLHLSDVQNRDYYNLTAEAWSAKEFDLYQEVENAPVGVYEIEVQGFFRYGRDDAGKEAYQAQEVDYVKKGGAPVYVYLNDVKTPFMNIYDEPSQGQEFYATMAQVDETTGEYKKGENGVYQWRGIPYSVQNYPANAEVPDEYYPNGMTSAALAFSAGLYKQTAKSLIAKKGDKMRIGVKGSTQLPENSDCWVIWDNFKLVYEGYTADVVKPVLEEQIAAAEAKEREAEAEFIREERESVREHYRSLGINNAKPDDTDDVYGSPRRSDASGYSSDPVYDDRIELTPSTNNPTPTTSAGSVSTTTVPTAVVEVSETSAVIATPIKIENARFINEQNTTHIAKGELVKISFEIRNMSDAAINNVVPVVKETTGNKHLLISPSTLVERLAAHKAIRYTAYVSAEKTLKTGTAHFVIAIYSDNNQISNTIEFDVTLN